MNNLVKKIGIIGAMDEEIELFLQSMSGIQEVEHAGIIYYKGTMGAQAIVLCKSGVGKVNASICTQILIDHFHIDYVIFTGVAGGVDPSLEIGDIVVSDECQQHDIDASALGFKKGEIPFAAFSTFKADPFLVQLAERCARNLEDVHVRVGKVLSGDQFVADKGQVEELFAQFKASCVEMEGAAVAQVCALNQIPFVIIRSLSDKADHSAQVNFLEFTKLAARRSFYMVEEMIKQME